VIEALEDGVYGGRIAASLSKHRESFYDGDVLAIPARDTQAAYNRPVPKGAGPAGLRILGR
jgi:hypothetical protein